MAYVIGGLTGDPEKLDFLKIHQSAVAHAHQSYLEEYGVWPNGDPQHVIGNERHKFWLGAFEKRQESLILNPHQD